MTHFIDDNGIEFNIVDDNGIALWVDDNVIYLGGEPDPAPPSGPTTLMPQICMSLLILIGGIATYFLDK